MATASTSRTRLEDLEEDGINGYASMDVDVHDGEQVRLEQDGDWLDEDILQALLEHECEYDWAELDQAPLPPDGTPAQFFVHTKTVNESALGGDAVVGKGGIGLALGVDAGNGGKSSQGSAKGGKVVPGRAAKKKAERIVQSMDLWQRDTFPFGYAAVRPPERLHNLLPLRASDAMPQTSIIQSPYQRIPPYTYYNRTSSNWRTERQVNTRCSLSYVPFFGEDGFADEDEFKDKLVSSSVKLNFFIPHEGEEDDPQTEPGTAICGICLTVGCIMHHVAPAVPQPQSAKQDILEASVIPSGSRFGRVKARRAAQGCGRDCTTRVTDQTESDYVPYEEWSQPDKDELRIVLTSLGPEASSCVIAGYLSNQTCRDVDFALRDRKRASPELDSLYAASKKQKVVHEDHHQADMMEEVVPPEELDEFTPEEITMRMPRTTLPWAPCYHPGRPCSSFTGDEDPRQGAFCMCKRHSTWCEPGCGCPIDCSERFRGCECAAGGGSCREPVNTDNGRTMRGCPCIEHARECHPDLCASHDMEKPCKGMTVQGDNIVRTFIAASELEGWGLFVGEDAHLAKIYIGDYRGEVVNEHTANLRSLLYQGRDRSFLFDLTRSGIVDGIRLGNKMRYMNTAIASGDGRGSARMNNCRGGSTMVNGEVRIVIQGHRHDGRLRFKENEELLLDYGKSFELFEDNSK